MHYIFCQYKYIIVFCSKLGYCYGTEKLLVGGTSLDMFRTFVCSIKTFTVGLHQKPSLHCVNSLPLNIDKK